MDFIKWLSLNEGKWGPINGAVGNTARDKPIVKKDLGHAPNPITPELTPIPSQRHDNRFMRIDQRVNYGKGIEKQIFDSLISCGMKLREPSSSEDMYAKIDGWWDINGKEVPIQIKYRDTGSDILFEVMKDYRRNIPGRDMIGKAIFYAVLIENQIVIVSVDEAKKYIHAAMKTADMEGFDNRGNFRAQNGIMLRIRPDPSSGQEKLMAYLPVFLLKNVRPPCQPKVTF